MKQSRWKHCKIFQPTPLISVIISWTKYKWIYIMNDSFFDSKTMLIIENIQMDCEKKWTNKTKRPLKSIRWMFCLKIECISHYWFKEFAIAKLAQFQWIPRFNFQFFFPMLIETDIKQIDTWNYLRKSNFNLKNNQNSIHIVNQNNFHRFLHISK